ncbi:GDP-fucose protein O-fucosyltransferase [Arabidopsis suecica]|uniref:O-fucosyltransferase family protein n=1 Tax=Arabidopsis suecica TaxID=45249 RepID=A0A8T2HFN8_ARASU|nr:GDP-fucose protein O-fucosyltransferase [Arabidopsis suecica]
MSSERPDEEKPETRDVLRVQDLIHGGGGASPVQSPTRLGPTRFSEVAGDKILNTGSNCIGSVLSWINGDPNRNLKNPVKRAKRKRIRTAKTAAFVIVLVGFFIFVNWFMLSQLHEGRAWLRRGFSKKTNLKPKLNPDPNSSVKRVSVKVSANVQHKEKKKMGKPKKTYNGTYGRLLAYAAHALAEGQNKLEPKELWREPKDQALAWKPCADQRSWKPSDGKNGYIMVTANGGINQQRVAVCNIVVVARMLNATLVVPKFMFSDVWTDASQFGDIYQVEHFIKYLSPDIRIVKKLPKELQSLDLEAIGSVVTDIDVMKEAKPGFYMKHILPLLLKNRVVHFFGFGNRLAFDPIPFELQRLRCRCNFHALNFVPKIQETGAILVRRLRDSGSHLAPVDPYLVGPKFASFILDKKAGPLHKASKYLAVHLRFEIDMVSHSLCYFGGGDAEKAELDAYREMHFPTLANLTKTKKMPSPDDLRTEGLCPLSPEEAVLMLAGLGFGRKTRVFVAGANIYGGNKRLAALTSLYPNLVTKENVLSQTELEPFKNFSSQLAVLDFIACAASDAFAMTDSGSQLSSLVSGYRIYYGAGKMPTIRPNKRRFSDILLKNNTIEWKVFEQRVRKTVRQTKHVLVRPTGRSVYRYPRCKECMCNED